MSSVTRDIELFRYHIEQLWIEGRTPVEIADEIDCHIDLVHCWLDEENLLRPGCQGYAC